MELEEARRVLRVAELRISAASIEHDVAREAFEAAEDETTNDDKVIAEIHREIDGAIGHMLAEVTAVMDPRGEPMPLPYGLSMLEASLDRARDAVTAALKTGEASGMWSSPPVEAVDSARSQRAPA